jgi:hypothetical protein
MTTRIYILARSCAHLVLGIIEEGGGGGRKEGRKHRGMGREEILDFFKLFLKNGKIDKNVYIKVIVPMQLVLFL